MSVYRRKSGRWAVRIDLDSGALGNRRRRSLGTFKTRKDAEKAEREALMERDRGIDLVPGRVLLSELLERYLQDRERLGRESKTMQEYRGIASRLILPHLGSISLAKLRPAHIAEWVAMLRERGGQNGKPLSTKSTHHAFSLVNGALRWAVRMELIGRNVCESVTAPTPKRSDAKAMTADEMGRVLAMAVETRWAAFLALAFSLGMRRGELCALSWPDVNFTDATLTVRYSLSQTKRGIVLKATKSNKTRTLPLSRIALEALRSQHALQAKDKLAAGSLYQDNGAIFADELGQRITPMTATCAFKRIAKRAKVTTTRLHDTRHTAATTMLTGGVDVRTVAGVLGHTNANITLATYAHLLADSQREALDRLGERVEKAAQASPVSSLRSPNGHRSPQKTEKTA